MEMLLDQPLPRCHAGAPAATLAHRARVELIAAPKLLQSPGKNGSPLAMGERCPTPRRSRRSSSDGLCPDFDRRRPLNLRPRCSNPYAQPPDPRRVGGKGRGVGWAARSAPERLIDSAMRRIEHERSSRCRTLRGGATREEEARRGTLDVGRNRAAAGMPRAAAPPHAEARRLLLAWL